MDDEIPPDEAYEEIEAHRLYVSREAKRREDMLSISVLGSPGYETYSIDEDPNIYVRPIWNHISCPPQQGQKVLAVWMPDLRKIYNCGAHGYFWKTVYACWYENGRYILESHGPDLPATHWMPRPELPRDE